MRVGKYSHVPYGDPSALKARIAHFKESLAYWQRQLSTARGGFKGRADDYADHAKYTKLQIAELEDALAECA
jgi:hypothetical protein